MKVKEGDMVSLFDDEGYEVFRNKIGIYERLNAKEEINLEGGLEMLNETNFEFEENENMGDQAIGTGRKVIEEESEEEEDIVEIFGIDEVIEEEKEEKLE